jgi:hypothetical protein
MVLNSDVAKWKVVSSPLVVNVAILLLKIWGKVVKGKIRTELFLLQREHICRHLWHIYTVIVYQVMCIMFTYHCKYKHRYTFWCANIPLFDNKTLMTLSPNSKYVLMDLVVESSVVLVPRTSFTIIIVTLVISCAKYRWLILYRYILFCISKSNRFVN